MAPSIRTELLPVFIQRYSSIIQDYHCILQTEESALSTIVSVLEEEKQRIEQQLSSETAIFRTLFLTFLLWIL